MKQTGVALLMLMMLSVSACTQISEKDRSYYMQETRMISEQARDMASQAQDNSYYALQRADAAEKSAQRAAMAAAATEEKMSRMLMQSTRK